MSEWYYAQGNDKHGPVSSKQLKQLALTGKLLPTDLVWKEGASDWKPASLINGLFPEEKQSPAPALPKTPPIPPAKVAPNAPASANGTEKWYYHPVTIVISLLFCFPVGLILIWTHTNWSTNQKWVWTGGYAAIMIVFLSLGKGQEPAPAPGQLAAPADQQPPVRQPVVQQPPVAQPAQQPTVMQPEAEPVIQVDSKTFIDEGEGNEVAFNTKYQGKLVEITGTIQGVGEGIVGRLYVDLKSGFLPITCYFPNSYSDKLATLSNGKRITIRGRVHSTHIIEDCEF
mgnify:CR=1 FL=1